MEAAVTSVAVSLLHSGIRVWAERGQLVLTRDEAEQLLALLNELLPETTNHTNEGMD